MKETDNLGLKLMDNNPQDNALTFLEYRRAVSGYDDSNMVKIDNFSKSVRSGLASQTSLVGNGSFVSTHMTPGSSVSARLYMDLNQDGSGTPSDENIRPFIPYNGSCLCVSSEEVRIGLGDAYAQQLSSGITVKKNTLGVFTLNGEASERSRFVIWESEEPYFIPYHPSHAIRLVSYFETDGMVEVVLHFYGEDREVSRTFSRNMSAFVISTYYPGKAIDRISLLFPEGSKYFNTKFTLFLTEKDDFLYREPDVDTFIRHSIAMFENPIYAGMYDMRTGELKKTWEVATLDGVENKFEGSSSMDNRRGMIYLRKLSSTIGGRKGNAIQCPVVFTHFPSMTNTDIFGLASEGCGGAVNWNGNTGKLVIQLPESSEATDAESMNQWLQAQVQAGTPVQVAWELATPEVTQEEVIALELPNTSGPHAVWSSAKEADFYGSGAVKWMTSIHDDFEERISKLEDFYGIRISAQPDPKPFLVNHEVSFTVNAHSLSNLTYQWQWNGIDGEWQDIDSTYTDVQQGTAQASTIVFDVPEWGDPTYTISMHEAYNIRCKITNEMGFYVYSDLITIRRTYIEITAQPEDTIAASGGYATFEVSAQSGYTLSYQWQVVASSVTAWQDSSLAGNKTPKLDFKTLSGYNGRYYRCKITCPNGVVVYTDPAQLTVYEVGTAATELTACKEELAYPYTELALYNMLIDGEMRLTDNIKIASSEFNTPRNYYYKIKLSPADPNGRNDEISGWVSSNTNVCTVQRAGSGGKNRATVVPVGYGVSYITATTITGATCTFCVKISEPT